MTINIVLRKFKINTFQKLDYMIFFLIFLESELVSGFMTEHSSVIFVFFFLAEYASIVLICALNSLLFLGGYLSIIPLDILINILDLFFNIKNTIIYDLIISISSSPLNLAFKTAFLIFVFIWARASFPRIRFDQLMSVCWTVLLPIIIAYIVLIPCIVFGFGIIPVNISLM